MSMMNRTETLRSTFKDEFDGYLIMNQINMLYFTDFLGAAATLVPSDEESILYVRGVNYEDARVRAQNCRVELVKPKEELHERIAKDVGKLGLKKLAFDTMNVVPFKKLSKELKRAVKLEA